VAVTRAALAFSLAVVGCGGADKPSNNTTVTVEVLDDEPDSPEAREAAVERLASIYLELGARVETAGADCNKVAAEIIWWTEARREKITELQKLIDAAGPDEQKRLVPYLEARLKLAADKVRAGQSRCAEHEGVFDAVSKLGAIK